jgi:hypothetical protein
MALSIRAQVIKFMEANPDYTGVTFVSDTKCFKCLTSIRYASNGRCHTCAQVPDPGSYVRKPSVKKLAAKTNKNFALACSLFNPMRRTD